jgi:hypothetical protein
MYLRCVINKWTTHCTAWWACYSAYAPLLLRQGSHSSRKVINITLHITQQYTLWIEPTDPLSSSFLLVIITLHVSGSLSAHHQELLSRTTTLVQFMQLGDRVLPGSGRKSYSPKKNPTIHVHLFIRQILYMTNILKEWNNNKNKNNNNNKFLRSYLLKCKMRLFTKIWC